MRSPDAERQAESVETVTAGVQGGAGEAAGNLRVPLPRDDDDELEPTIVLGRE
ncbi:MULTISPECIES: hypothetical protein [Prauserella]|uniref:hypothetical protein n=1 Tax=Prauserella TaxID=142577 RepID=UPI0014775F00|nr:MULTISPECIES: hypothetical protein [Prauserella]